MCTTWWFRSRPTVRFVSGLTLISPHCVLHTVIQGRVLGSQAVHLQIQRVLAVVSGDGESALHRICVVCATSIIANNCDPLQPLPWSLADPMHVVATEGESRGCTGESQGPSRLHQVSPRLHQLHFTLDTCRHKTSWLGNCHISISLTHIHSHTPCPLFTLDYLLEFPGELVLFCSDHCMGSPWIPGPGAPLSFLGSGLGCFNQQKEGPICMASAYTAGLGSVLTEWAVARSDVIAFDSVVLTFAK